MSLIKDFYKERTIFITGGTGFMGKVLLEKLLRSLPEINKIYVLLRPKKGLTPTERIAEITSKPPFTLNNLGEDDFKKLVAVHGDTTQAGLGLSTEDKLNLTNNVSVVFHLAAAVRMNLNLKEAVQQNTTATLNVLNLSEEIKGLVSFVHLSTAYCNIEIDYMEEKIYKLDIDPYKIIDIVQWMDDDGLNRAQDNIMKPHPNSYTFTKRLSEILAWDFGEKLPVVICRPSIVTPSLKEPCPGWIDNFNGPVGLLVAAGKGLIRSAFVDRKCIPEIVPVDVAINSLIVCGWFRTTSTFSETPIYNVTQPSIQKATWGLICDIFRDINAKYPYKRFLWCTVAKETTNIWLHSLIVFLFQMIPAYIIDVLLIIFMQKPFLVNMQNRLNVGMNLLRYFAVRPWTFTNTELLKIKEILPRYDLDEFYLFPDNTDLHKYIHDCFFGARKFCVKESCDNLLIPKIICKILMCLEYTGRILLVYGMMWIALYLFSSTHLLSYDYWNSWTSSTISSKI